MKKLLWFLLLIPAVAFSQTLNPTYRFADFIQNTQAVKKQSQGKQQDTEHMAIVEEEINELPGPRYLTQEESQVAFNLARHFNCDGVLQVSPDCNAKPGVLPDPGKAGLVSVESVFRSWAATIEYAHDLERTAQCYEDSMKVTK